MIGFNMEKNMDKDVKPYELESSQTYSDHDLDAPSYEPLCCRKCMGTGLIKATREEVREYIDSSLFFYNQRLKKYLNKEADKAEDCRWVLAVWRGWEQTGKIECQECQ